MDSAPDANVLVLQRGIQILHIDVLLLETQLWVALRPVERQISELVRAPVIRILDELILFGLLFLTLAESLLLGKLLGILLVFLLASLFALSSIT